MSKKLLISNSHIYSALLLYGHDNFNLEILEYCDKKYVINREQYYMNLLNPEYNILKIAGSRLGFKHSPETLLKLRNRKFTAEALANIRKSIIRITSEKLLNNDPISRTGHCVTILNSNNNSIIKHKSIRSAARDLGVSHSTVIDCIKNNRLLKDLYIITKDN
jgi:group I intron endonuclease